MKKFLTVILAIIVFLYFSVQLFNIYHENHLLDNEAVLNIYPNLPDDKVDEFFLLPKGTYDSKKHSIIYSFIKADNYQLDYYYNLPEYNYDNLKNINCNESFSKEKHVRFQRNEIIDDGILYVRLLNHKQNGFDRGNDSRSTLAIRKLAISFTFGKINSTLVNSDGAIRYCD
ncbi:hypothetical protein [Flavobacterium sp. LC2016-01]|uniref:hypothetical protein n=1 Tax=Flavobacterium sp. LC2016-01 TaxID=2675876 RepID=UPI0012BA655D|nr:hypothetical protein [Flavobacterium sp. LC2016-01]MTH18226.1 hypothetical protein [Flavobacterium sp. LC2016-01]